MVRLFPPIIPRSSCTPELDSLVIEHSSMKKLNPPEWERTTQIRVVHVVRSQVCFIDECTTDTIRFIVNAKTRERFARCLSTVGVLHNTRVFEFEYLSEVDLMHIATREIHQFRVLSLAIFETLRELLENQSSDSHGVVGSQTNR